MIKKSPIKKPFFFDTPQGVDHVTNTVAEDSIEKMTPLKKDQLDKLNRDMKLSLLKSEEKTLKKFMNEDPSTYPSDPEQRGKLMNIQALEKSLNIRPDSWKRFVKTGALPLAEKKPDLWKDVLYPSMTIHEKAQWNAQERKKGYDGRTGAKLEKQKQKDHLNKLEHFGIENSSVKHEDYPKNDGVKYVGSRQYLYDEEKKEKKIISKPKSLPGVQSILAIDLPSQRFTPEITPEETQSLDQKLHNTKIVSGLSPELLGLQKQINRNVDYVLGADQKDESRDKDITKKEETYD